MVRLKVLENSDVLDDFFKFQFHYGSVKSRCGGENDPPVSGLLLL